MKKTIIFLFALAYLTAGAQTYYMMPNGFRQDSISLFTPIYAAIAGKQAAGSYVDLSTAQTILGVKTFQGSTATDAGLPLMVLKNSSGSSGFELKALASPTNLAMGMGVFPAITTGLYNTGVGTQVGTSTTTGSYNFFAGYQAAINNVGGGSNTSTGVQAGYSNVGGNTNSDYGAYAGQARTSGNNNVNVGGYAGNANVTGGANVALGYKSLINALTANSTISIGQSAGRYITGGAIALTNVTNGVYIGDGARAFKDSVTDEITIGAGTTGNNSHTATVGNTANTAFYFNGTLNANSYGTGANTGVAAYDIRETAAGKFIEVALPTTAFNTITATASQTAFVFPLVPAVSSNFMLFKNGALLLPTTNYTVSGNTITLLTASAVNDVIALQRLQ